VQNLQVAKFYGVSPDEVENIWTNIDFLDRLEFMYIQNEVDRIYLDD
jgi:hypothetical protein